MALPKFKTKEEIPDAFRDLYKQVDGEWVYAEAAAPVPEQKNKVDEFRDNNRRLQKELKETQDALADLHNQFKGINPEKHRKAVEALEKMEESEEKQLIEQGRWEDVANRRVNAYKKQIGDRVSELELSNKKLNEASQGYFNKYSRLKVEQQLDAAAAKAGLRFKQGATKHAYDEVNSIYKMHPDTGEINPMDPKGNIIKNEQGDVLEMSSWVKDHLLKESPYLFESSQGGDAPGSSNIRMTGSRTLIDPRNPNDFMGPGKLEAIAKGNFEVTP